MFQEYREKEGLADCHDTLGFKGLDILSRPLTFQRKSCCRVEAFRDSYCRNGFLDSDCRSDFFLHGFLHWRTLRLGLGHPPLPRRRYLARLTAFG
jgi:hypothetical protein